MSTPVPPVTVKLPDKILVKSMVIFVFAPERLAVPEPVFLVPLVATKPDIPVALAFALTLVLVIWV